MRKFLISEVQEKFSGSIAKSDMEKIRVMSDEWKVDIRDIIRAGCKLSLKIKTRKDLIKILFDLENEK